MGGTGPAADWRRFGAMAAAGERRGRIERDGWGERSIFGVIFDSRTKNCGILSKKVDVHTSPALDCCGKSRYNERGPQWSCGK
jgi:hypothetical protein